MRTAFGVAVALVVLASGGSVHAQTPPPAATPAPAPAISVDRARAGIPLGTSLTVNVGGTTGPLTVQVPFDGLEAAYDPATRRLTLTGRAAGSGTLTLTDRAGRSGTIAVLVAPPAGVIPSDIDVALAGTVGAPFVTSRIRDALDRALVRQPGTGLDVHGLAIPPALGPGDHFDGQAGVTLDGRGAFVDVSGRTNVHVVVDPEPPLEPGFLFYSDDPEYVGPQLAGVLFRGTVDVRAAARLFAYHVAAGAPRRMSLVLLATTAAHVQILGTVSGASPAFAYIGQQSTVRFLAAHASGESTILSLAAGVPYEIAFSVQQPGDLIEAIEDVRVLDGGPVDLVLVTRPPDAPLPPLDGPELPGDDHGRRGVYALTGVPPIDLTYTSGAPDPAPVSVGESAPANLRAGGKPLGGDYGILRPLALHLANSTATPLQVYLYELTSGTGGATSTLWFDGESAPTIVPCIDDANSPHLIKAFALAAGATRTVSGAFMTDGAASYPLRFGLTATTPLPVPPNACAPPP